MALDNQLIVSEAFYSIQGEGYSAGCPAVFLRLTGCNLRCQGFSYFDKETQQHLGCDTAHVWKYGDKINNIDIIKTWEQQGWINRLIEGSHLVITGGDPTIQQEALINFIKSLDKATGNPCYIEMETNATISILPKLLERLNQINASPKLSSNGDPVSKTYHPEVIDRLAKLDKTKFKFVVISKEDIKEIINKYIQPFNINKKNVWLMPEGGTREDIRAKAEFVVELCKQYMLNYSPRLQIDIWDEVVGV